MKKLIKIAKGVVLYGTILYCALLLICIESLLETNFLAGLFMIITGIAFVLINMLIFKNDNIEEYVPKKFR